MTKRMTTKIGTRVALTEAVTTMNAGQRPEHHAAGSVGEVIAVDDAGLLVSFGEGSDPVGLTLGEHCSLLS